MGNFLDKNSVSEILARIKSLCPKWAKEAKKREQIIIGKAIRIQSCDVKDAENWYVQNTSSKSGRVCIRIPVEYQNHRIIIAYREAKESEYQKGNFVWDTKQKVGILTVQGINQITKWKVDKYTISTLGKIVTIRLTYKQCPSTIRGTSLRYEYVNGRKVWNHSFTINDLKQKSLYDIFKKYRLYQRRTCNRNRKARMLSNEGKRNHSNLRWKRIRKLTAEEDKKAGLYRAICVDKKRRCTASLTFYFAQSGLIKRN